MRAAMFSGLLAAGGAFVLGCAGQDNPVALADLEVQAEFQLEVPRIETFEQAKIAVRPTHQGSPVKLRLAELEVEPAAGGTVQTVVAQAEGEHYVAEVTFFQPGEHHLHFMGQPERHHLMKEMGEHEVEVHRAHRVIGPYWVELEANPVPILEGSEAHLKIYTYAVGPDSTRGTPAGGLKLHLALHQPHGEESTLTVTEEQPAVYQAAFAFGEAGSYELHVEIEIDGAHEEVSFQIPVLSRVREEIGTGKPGGHGHGT